MSAFLKIPESTALGFHALGFLASNPRQLVTINDIAQFLSASEAHLAKVLQALRRAGLVLATRGPSGGYQLNRDASKIYLLEVHEALQGPQTSRSCLLRKPKCEGGPCALSYFAKNLDEEFRKFLSTTTLDTFAFPSK